MAHQHGCRDIRLPQELLLAPLKQDLDIVVKAKPAHDSADAHYKIADGFHRVQALQNMVEQNKVAPNATLKVTVKTSTN